MLLLPRQQEEATPSSCVEIFSSRHEKRECFAANYLRNVTADVEMRLTGFLSNAICFKPDVAYTM